MKRVTGIGGIFFNAKDPVALRAWYKQTWASTSRNGEARRSPGPMQRAIRQRERPCGRIGAADGEHFAPSKSTFMVNYRVEDLAAVMQVLRDEGCNVLEKDGRLRVRQVRLGNGPRGQ